MIIPYGPGGTPDILGRGIGSELQSEHGMNVTVSNRAGAAGTIAINETVNADPDGTTVALATSNSVLWQPVVEDGLSYDQDSGYEALAKAGESPFSITVPAESRWDSFDDFIADAEAGEEINLAVTGEGAQTDLTVDILNDQNDWNIRSVPYSDGAGEGLLAALRGEVDGLLSTTAGVQGQIDSDDARVLAVIDEQTEPNNPDAETFADHDLEVPMPTTFYVIATDELDEETRDTMATILGDITTSDEWDTLLEETGLIPGTGAAYDDTQDEISTLIGQYDELEETYN